MEEILLEKKLTTDFTMGFELEGCWFDSDASTGEIQQWFDENLQPGGDVHYDGSLDTDDRGGQTFEYASPVLPVNVGTIQKILNMYKAGLDDKFYTNDTCGYHHHISFPGITAEDMVWIMCKLALNDRVRSKISAFEGIEFANEQWADDAYLDRLKEAVENDDYKGIINICKTDKYSLVNVHAHNTLEWRGPRGVVDTGDMGTILGFYKRFWAFVNWMTEALDETEINNVSKENFMSQIRAAMGNSRSINGFQFKKEKRKDGLLSDEKLKEICNNISNNPKILANFMKHNALEQILQHLFNTNRLGLRVKNVNESSELTDEMKKKINNLCYKYIPYRMLFEYRDSISTDTIYNTSELTMKRYLKTSKLNRTDVTQEHKLTLLNNNCEEFNPTIFKKETCSDIYEWTGWNLNRHMDLFKLLVKEGYANALSEYSITSIVTHIPTDDRFEPTVKLLLSTFMNKPEAKEIIVKLLFKYAVTNPELIIPMFKFNTKQIIWIVGKILNESNSDEMLGRLHKVLIETGKIEEEEWLKILQMYHRAHNTEDVTVTPDEDEINFDGKVYNKYDDELWGEE